MKKPHKIRISPTEKPGPGGCGYAAINENGDIIGRHFCSSPSWAVSDLGKGRKEEWDKLFPEGWEVSYIPHIYKKPRRPSKVVIAKLLLEEGAFVEAGDL